MKKTWYRISLTLLAVVIMLSCLAACSDKDSSGTSSNATGDVKPITSAEGTSETEEDALKAMAIKYAGTTIGVQIGTVFDAMINQYIPEANVEYYNSNADMALALKTGKISAYIADEPMARLLCQSYEDQYITGVFEKCPYAYIYPKDTNKTKTIRAQMNEYLSKIKSDGTLEKIDETWFGDDESLKVVDTSDLTAENGTLEFSIVSAVGAPFVYVKDNAYVGYDVDIAVRFCREYGYGINITDYNVGGFFASIATAKGDFGASSVCITEERKEEMDFSEPNYEGSVVLVTKDFEETDVTEVSSASKFDVLKGKSIGVIRDTNGIDYLENTIPSAKIVETDSANSLVDKLESGEIDAYICDQPLLRQVLYEHSDHHVLGVAEKNDYGFVFKKDSQRADMLRTQMNSFLQTISEDGTLEEIDSIWFGEDDSKKKIDYSDLKGHNGTIKLALSTSICDPFFYYKDGTICGYEADIAYRFCKAYGYNLEFYDAKDDFAKIFTLVESGEYDMGASCITITEERQKKYNFSDPDYHGGMVIVNKQKDEFDVSEISDSSILAEMSGKKIGYLSDTILDDVAKSAIDSPEMIAFPSHSEISEALENGTIDAYITDQPMARIQTKSYENHHVYACLDRDNYAYAFQKDNKEYPLLQMQMNYFLKDLKAEGTLDELDEIWFGDNVNLQTVDFSTLTGENGTLKLGILSSGSVPFCYKNDDQYVGYEIDIAVRFCQEYGYGLEIIECDSTQQLLNGVEKGKYDFACDCFSVTAERKKVVDFSDPYYYGGYMIITKSTNAKIGSQLSIFFNSVVNSFRKTFIREDRWKMFAGGLGITVLMTLLSALFGSALGFGLYLLYRKERKIANGIMDRFSAFIQMTPIVVILMIFYYLILAKSGLSGVAVSVIAFSMMFACATLDLFKSAVLAVGTGQSMAVRALGYRDTQGFLRMILPQAIPHFMTGYKGALVSLIKGTSIVSYVAVQDLTMVTDIIRSRTYEAFFPLVMTAIIYFMFAMLLTKIVERIEIKMNPVNRTENQILKGVNTK